MSHFSELKEATGLSVEQLVEILGVSARTIYRWECGETTPKQAIFRVLESYISNRKEQEGGSLFNFIDLFAGIGGFRRAFESVGGECLFTSEWDKYSQQTYRANFDCSHEIAGDITKIDAQNIPRHDILLAGFPCQPFSLAGVSKKNSLSRPHGFRDEAQGTLFFDVARIIEYHRPKAFLLENVKNLISHDKKKTFQVIYRTLTEELGYNVSYRIIDAKGWVPQHRERIFIAGFRDPVPFSLNDMELVEPGNGPKLSSILHPEDGSESIEDNMRFLESGGKVLSKYTLTDHLWSYLQAYAEKHRQKGNGFGCSVVTGDDVTRTLSARYHKDGSEILVARGEGKNPRRLTPRECARLMGFDLPGESTFRIPVSDTQAYRQFGNAVVVPVVSAIARSMVPFITAKKEAQ